MAPTHTAVAVNVERKLAHRAAAFLAKSDKPPKRLVEDLLGRMGRVRLRRESLGLNHWQAYATAYLQRLVQRHESLRRRAVAAFFRTERRAAVARAEAMLGSREEGEDAAGEAFVRLFSGKTRIPLFYRTLRLICVDRLRQRGRVMKLLASETEFGGTMALDANPASIVGRPEWDSGCGDPLEILIHREEIQAGIAAVLSQRRNKSYRRFDWWRELLSHHRPGWVGRKRPAQTNR